MRPALLLAALVAAPAVAGSALPVVHHARGEGSVWVALLLDVRGPTAWELMGDVEGPRISYLFAEYGEDGTFRGGEAGLAHGYGEVSAGVGETRAAVRPHLFPADRMGVGAELGTPLRSVFVLMLAGDVGEWDLTVRGDASVRGATSGPAFDATSRAFASTAHAHAEVWGASATTASDGTLVVNARDSLVGIYHAADSLLGRASAQTPSGPRACACWFTGAPGAENGPGQYVFRFEGAQARLDGDLRVLGGDVRLPRAH